MSQDNENFVNKELVSIICVTRNAVNHLENCLKSIFEQTYPHIEIVIFDGNSTDGTQEILKKWNDKIAFWKSEPDDGIYDAMNKAVKYIKGQWVYFMGADDILLPEFSDFAKNELKCQDTIYYSNVLFDNKKVYGEFTKYQYLKHCINHQSIIYPATVFKEYKYDTRYKVSADQALNIQLYGSKQYKFKYCDYVVAIYATTGFSSKYMDKQLRIDLPKYALKYFGIINYLRIKFRLFKARFSKEETRELL